MGSICMKHLDVADASENSTASPLTTQEIHLVNESWKVVTPHWKEICELAFERSLSSYGVLRIFFRTENPELGLPEVLNSSIIQNHTDNFKNLVERAIAAPSLVQKQLLEYGKIHYEYGVKEEYIKNLANNTKTEVCCYIEDSSDGKKTHRAWERVFTFLSDTLIRGMERAEEENGSLEVSNGRGKEMIDDLENNRSENNNN
ncbi:uncharacterized protein LOC130647886 [Hydractinia symbiolongicarpus]|uniref:uncharacterized protein LOC130647886 n=1 Tax=Hydractinia symbiolongicarpus TaxID=13093 RepID=UPI00254FC84A|nr:uncharacterized protein LOC130647886 [Hydractinia symbiolongicarpus]